MKVRMKVKITGDRDGQEWPAPGEELTVPDDEGVHLCANGMADPVAAAAKVETATAPDAEVRAPVRKRTPKG
jgi:hypothetical protein